jgi:hypothetical protein
MFNNFTYEGKIGGNPVSGVGITELAARTRIIEKIDESGKKGGFVTLILNGDIFDIIYNPKPDYKIRKNKELKCTQLLGLGEL